MADDALRELFLRKGAGDLAPAERELIASWRHHPQGRYIIERHLQKPSIFTGDGVYGVLGIYTPLAVMFPHVPKYLEAVFLPFRDVIITDGLIGSP